MNKNVNEKLPKEQRLGQVGINNQGEKITIIAYRKENDIDIQFEDEIIVTNRAYSNFLKGKIKHPIRYEESFAYHIEIVLGIKLDNIWNWEKNNKLSINPYEITKCSSKKVWLYCQEHDYHNYDKEGNKVGYQMTCANFYNGEKCGYCNDNHKTHWKDSLGYKYSHIAKMIAIKENDLTFEDTFYINCGSGQYFYFKCNKCGKVSDKKLSIYQVTKYDYSCQHCSDKISIPNKILRQISKQLNLDWNFEYTSIWLEDKRLDGYDDNLKIAIEMDAEYQENHKGERKEVDSWKDEQCLKHGIYTIRINLMNTKEYQNNKFYYIKQQILNSPLNQIYDLSKIDWKLAWEESQDSLVIKAWELYNNRYNIDKISEILNLDKSTIYRYLKRGAECGKCNYVGYKRNNKVA